MPIQFTPADAGKRVVTPDGTLVGWVDHIRDGTAYVTPQSGVLAGIGPRIGPGLHERETFPLDTRRVAATTDAAVVLAEGPPAEKARGSRPIHRRPGVE